MLDYCIYHIRMDTPEPQKQFELWWAWHSISRLKSLRQENSDPKCRNDIVVFTNNNTKHWCKCLDTLSKKSWKQYPPKSGTISEPSTSSYTSSQRNPMPHEVSEATALCVLCIHGRLRLQEPLDHGIAAFEGCPVQRCFASGAAARGQATGRTQPNEGEKNSQKIWAPQKSKFWKLWPLKNPPWTWGMLWFWDVLMTSSWLKKAMWTRLAVKTLWGNFKNVPSLRKQICVRLGHNRIWNQSRAVDISCNRVRGLARILTGKKHKFLRFVRTANNDPVKQCLITVYTISEWTLRNLRNSLNCDGHDTLFLD